MARRHVWVRVAVVSGVVALAILGVWSALLQDPGGARDQELTPELRAVADRQPLRVGWFVGSEPVSIWQDDEPVGGFGIQMWDLMAIELGLRVEHVLLGSIPEVVAALEEGSIDVAGLQGARPDLTEFAAGTDPLAYERIVYVGAPDLAGTDTADLTGIRVSTIGGSPLEAALRAANPEATFVETNSIIDGLRAAADGGIDLYLAPLAVTGFASRAQDIEVVPVGESLQLIPLSSWARQGSDALAIARTARTHLTDDEISLITQRSTGFDLGAPRSGAPDWVLRAFIAALAAAIVLGLLMLLFRRRVRAATQELRDLNAELEDRVEQRTAALAASNEALGRVAGAAAHDIKGPLSVIAGFAELMGQRQLEEGERAGMVAAIERSARSLIKLVDSLLRDAVEAGGTEPLVTGEALRAWLTDVASPQVHASNAVLAVEAPDGAIDADPATLRRVALNLVVNALKYGVPEGGAVRVALTRDADCWQLRVEDDGPGVPEELREAIFEHGFRGHEGGTGAGRGLAEIREQLRAQGGSVRIDEAPGGGASFTAVLPAITLDGEATVD